MKMKDAKKEKNVDLSSVVAISFVFLAMVAIPVSLTTTGLNQLLGK